MLSKIKHQMKVSHIPSAKRIQKTDKGSDSPAKKYQDRYSAGKKKKEDETKAEDPLNSEPAALGGPEPEVTELKSKHIDIVI